MKVRAEDTKFGSEPKRGEGIRGEKSRKHHHTIQSKKTAGRRNRQQKGKLNE